MKKRAKAVVASALWRQVRSLRTKNDIKVIAVVGSIGKTSTKFAIARVLGEKYRVRFQEGNYNDITTVPLVFFGIEQPNILNPLAWARILRRMKKQTAKPYPYAVVVIELGTDGPGQLAEFAQYLHNDITVLSAIKPEHMEYFGSLDEVAKEELSVAEYSSRLVINRDMVDKAYAARIDRAITFGSKAADYTISNVVFNDNGGEFSLSKQGSAWLGFSLRAVAMSEVYSATAAVVIGDMLGLSEDQLRKGVEKLRPVSGRMQRLKGVRNSVILDETYNASPDAVIAALDSLYAFKSKHKIAILGSMNELGHMSSEAHSAVGKYCNPAYIDLLVTIGADANALIAEEATKNGCRVATFEDPYAAGKYVSEHVKEGSVILAKGSQNGVYAEEAIKQLLAESKDAKYLVRQSKSWLKKKRKSFKNAKN